MLRVFFLIFIAFPFYILSQTDSIKPKRKLGPDIIILNENQKQKIDSLYAQLRKDSAYIYRFRKIRPYSNYHERHSLYNEVLTNFYGPQLGVVLFERHIVGLGAYFSGKKTREPFESLDDNVKVIKNINVNYITCFYQYILVARRFYEFHLPVEIGAGTYMSSFKDSLNQTYRTLNTSYYETCAGFHAIFKPVRWIGLSSTIGYRITNEKSFNGYFYSFGVWVGLRHALNDARYYLVKRKRYKQNVKEIISS